MWVLELVLMSVLESVPESVLMVLMSVLESVGPGVDQGVTGAVRQVGSVLMVLVWVLELVLIPRCVSSVIRKSHSQSQPIPPQAAITSVLLPPSRRSSMNDLNGSHSTSNGDVFLNPYLTIRVLDRR